MSWYKKSERTWLEKFCIDVLKQGPIPYHVAFIMDGNRRYAMKKGLEKHKGHAFGSEKLHETLGWCLDLGITEVTLYAFSIENFKRSKEEIDCLMDLLAEKISHLLKEKEKINEYEVCFRVYGDITLLPVEVQKLIAETVLLTCNNKKAYLNVCLAYTSREEIVAAVKEIATEVVQDNLEPDDINESLLNHALYSSKGTDPDIVIRTSGEIRLSDFLLWQSGYSVLSFFKVLWPDFRIWHLFLAVLYYQHYCSDMKAIKEKHNCNLHSREEKEDIALAKRKLAEINKHKTKESPTNVSEILDQLDTRRKNFLNHLDSENYRKLNQIKNGDTVQNKPPI